MGKIKVIERKVTFCFQIEEARKKGDWNRNLLCSEIEEIQSDPPKFQIKPNGDRFICRQKYKLKPYSGTPYYEDTCFKLEEKFKEPVIDLLKIFRKITRPSLPRQVTPPMLQPPPFLKKDTTAPPSPEPKKKSPEALPPE